MSTTALVLVVVAAFAHAVWNLLAKTASGGAVFVWLVAALSAVLLTPLAAIEALRGGGDVGLEGVVFMVGSGALHAGYFVLLQRGYGAGDLSLVYPLARGFGPLLSTLAAVLVLGERPSALALVGGAVIILAVLSLAYGGATAASGGVAYALATGVFIAGYTLWDKHAVGTLGLSPLVYYWGTAVSNALLLTVVARRGTATATWRDNRRAIVSVAVLSPLAYVLVLYALAEAPVSYVAPAREMSILVGAALGAQLLAEGDVRRRLACASAIVLGIAALALG